MKLWIGILGLLLSLAAQANDVAFRQTQQAIAMMGHGCNIRLQAPQRARVTSSPENRGSGGVTLENPFSLKIKNYVEPFYFGFTCYPADDGIVGAGAVRFDTHRKQWMRDIEKRIASIGGRWTAQEMAEMRHDFARAIKVYPLNTINASGYVYTEDDTTGDEQWRQRHLHYCLIKGPKALCGNGEMGYLKDGKKGDLTPYALQILRSIEFIDDVSATITPNDVSK